MTNDQSSLLIHCQRNHLSASKKQTQAQAARIARRQQTPARELPSSITSRRALLSWVSGKAWMNGCMTSGKRGEVEKTPESSHMGSRTRLMQPDTVSGLRVGADA